MGARWSAWLLWGCVHVHEGYADSSMLHWRTDPVSTGVQRVSASGPLTKNIGCVSVLWEQCIAIPASLDFFYHETTLHSPQLSYLWATTVVAALQGGLQYIDEADEQYQKKKKNTCKVTAMLLNTAAHVKCPVTFVVVFQIFSQCKSWTLYLLRYNQQFNNFE